MIKAKVATITKEVETILGKVATIPQELTHLAWNSHRNFINLERM